MPPKANTWSCSGQEIDETAGGVEVRLEDLVIRREERDRFEQEEGPVSPRLNGHAFKVLGDDKKVMTGGRVFHLGLCQAEVVRQGLAVCSFCVLPSTADDGR